ncbi:short chain dehydrogenase [Thermoascus aurantiacus ATCC 26904]
MAPRVWFITGCSTGFGRELALQVLQRGDRVIATARKASSLEELEAAGAKVLVLDVTASLDTLKQIAVTAHGFYGRIDVLVNNAGYVASGSIEELTPEETFSQFNTNVFSLLNVNRAFLPYLRAQRSGVIANISSIAGWAGTPGVSMYCANELAEFGIKVTSIEPGYFRSNILAESNRSVAKNIIQDYEGDTAARRGVAFHNRVNLKQQGDVVKGCRVIIDVLTQSGAAEGREIPIRLVLGADAYGAVKSKCESTIALLDEWKDITTPTDHDDVVV